VGQAQHDPLSDQSTDQVVRVVDWPTSPENRSQEAYALQADSESSASRLTNRA